MKKIIYILCLLVCISGCKDSVRRSNGSIQNDNSSEINTVENTKRCSFSDVQFPDDVVVYAVGAFSGKDLDFQVDDSQGTPTELQIYVNEPNKPVVLMLFGGWVNIWQLSWTPQTNIIAIFAGSQFSDLTRVVGPGSDIPLLTVANAHPGRDCEALNLRNIPNLTGRRGDRNQGDIIALKLFGRGISQVYASEVSMERIYIGDQLTESAYIQTHAQAAETFRLPHAPLVGSAGIEEAVRNGAIRQATRQDFDTWSAQGILPQGISVSNSKLQRTYIIQKPFQIPVGLTGVRSVNFVLPPDVAMPTGNLGHSLLIDLNTKTCISNAKPLDGDICSYF